MKKLTIFILVLLVMTGCEPKEQKQIELDIENNITEISYKGHKYLYFHKYDDTYSAVASIIHDPDCLCHNKQQEQ